MLPSVSRVVDTLGRLAALTRPTTRLGHSSQSTDEVGRQYPPLHSLLVALVALSVYLNSLGCGLAFDDMSAIRDNRDLRPQTPLTQLFLNDFWGQTITKEQSHKSYRPLSVLTFRLNYLIHETDPIGYHMVNVFLHVIVCLIYHRLCNLFMPSIAALIASLSFSVHPIHTEAVTSVVGRAETLSSVFFLLAFRTYLRATKNTTKTGWFWFLLFVVLVCMATLSKEQGITVIAVCCVYEVFIGQRLKLFNIYRIFTSMTACLRLVALIASFSIVIVARLEIMGSQLPVFTKFDNPATHADTPVRQLTYNYLLPLNAWLLLFPCDLCCDWTMGTIPLVESIEDPRNAATVVFYLVLLVLIVRSLTSKDEMTRQVLILSLALLVFPFLPASNLFFPVGFVIAERVLYMPSMGFCMLFGYGFHRMYINVSKATRIVLVMALVVVLSFHSIKTFVRNYDWQSEYTIFTAGLKITKQNAKLYNNVGHALESEAKYAEALQYFLKAVETQPDDIGAHMNVGRTYNNLNQFELAEQAFLKAKSMLPRAQPGQLYYARVAPYHLNVFLNLANLVARNKSRLEEADALYRQVIRMRDDYTQAYINRGDLLIKMNRTLEAQEVYEKALQFDNTNADIYYNLGVVLLKQANASQALDYFNKALELEPNHQQSLINSAIIIQESASPELRPLAQQRLNVLLESGKADERVYFNLGMLAMDDKNYADAEKWLRTAVNMKQDFRSATFNLALLLSDSNRPFEAVPFLKQLLRYHSDYIRGLILLGNIYLNHVRDLDAAEECYQRAIELEANNVESRHNLCIVYVQRSDLIRAEQCLQEVAAMAPNEEYIAKHLRIVRTRIAKREPQPQQRVTKDSEL